MPSVAVNPPKTPVTKGSGGVATATLPNICKMPPPPPPFAPTPLPNIGQSGKMPQGYSTSVKIEKQPVAITGASFGSSGDIASKATGGGIISNNAEGPTKFIAPGSLDVRIQGKNVQLLSDQMLNNCGIPGSPPNSATLAGVLQSPNMTLGDILADLNKIAAKCNKDENKKAGYSPGSKPSGRECTTLGTKKHTCCENAINAGKNPNVKAEQSFTRSGKPAPHGAPVRPDVVVMQGAKIVKVVDFKFNCSSKPSMSNRQFKKYRRAFKMPPKLIHKY
jgi:hypothetical protein